MYRNSKLKIYLITFKNLIKMRKKNFNKKLFLNKKTISSLNHSKMKQIKGGTNSTSSLICGSDTAGQQTVSCDNCLQNYSDQYDAC